VVERSEVAGSETPRTGATLIRVALIEDNRLVREALLSVLNQAPDIEAVATAPGESETGLGGVVLLDLGIENGASLRVARDILDDCPEARVVVMDLMPAHEDLQAFVSAGVSGFIMRNAHLDVVLNTIRSVASGLKVLPDEITAALFSELAWESMASSGSKDSSETELTPREVEVTDLIAEGLSNKAIGQQLDISVHTVKSHLRNIMDKLAVSSRLQIATHFHQRDADAQDLRRRAEARVEEDPRELPTELEGLSLEQVRRMLHELQVHQIELEMQNEELRQSRTELEASHARYFDLFDLAPVGYFTLTEDVRILEANLTGGELLGVPRTKLLDRPFTRYILPDDQDIYYHHRRTVVEGGSQANCELRMVRADGSIFHALLESASSRPVDGHATFRTVVSENPHPDIKAAPGTAGTTT
jgi:PAS domain S-box-containing protein